VIGPGAVFPGHVLLFVLSIVGIRHHHFLTIPSPTDLASFPGAYEISFALLGIEGAFYSAGRLDDHWHLSKVSGKFSIRFVPPQKRRKTLTYP